MNTRQTKILDLLNERGEVIVQELADQLDVTTMTIRRDLTALARGGNVIRTHGGAVLSNAGIIEFSFKRKGEKHAAEKEAIAREAATMVQPGMTVALDTGTTVLTVAKAIAGVQDLRVLTSSLVIASALYARDNIDLVLLGGKARRGSPDLFGWLTEENLKHFRVDVAILGADGVDPDGLYTEEESVGRVSQTMLRYAATTILTIDHSKLKRASFWKYASWNDMNHVITDDQVPRQARGWLRQVAGSVRYAKV